MSSSNKDSTPGISANVKTTGEEQKDETGTQSTPSNNVKVGTIQDMKNSERQGGQHLKDDNGGKKERTYVYRDFSQIPEKDFDIEYEIDQEGLLQALEESAGLAAAQASQLSIAQANLALPDPTRNIIRASDWVRSQRFPVKLYALLNQPALSPIITWMPHGRSWKVLKPRVFETTVLPVFFESDNYHSFNRVINAWSFRRKSTGEDRGSYFHELFLRGKPHLKKFMRRLPRTHKKLLMTKEPDFFELEKVSPLPSLEEAKAAVEMRKVQRLKDQLQREATGSSTTAQTTMFEIPAVSSEGSGLSPHFFPAPPGATYFHRGPQGQQPWGGYR